MEWLKKKRKLLSRPLEVLPDDGLETPEEKKERWLSIRIIYFTMFLISLGFSIILTGVWPYLDKLDPNAGKEFMGYVVAANPLGQMLFSPLIGLWANKSGSIRIPVLSTLMLFIISSGIYSMLEVFDSYQKYWMVWARFLVGVSSANIAAARSYISASTRLSERTGAVSMVSLAQVLGFVVGPGMQAAVTPLGDEGFSLGNFKMNMYTACGWINVVLGVLNFILFLPFIFKERKIAAKEAMLLQGKNNEKEAWKALKPDYLTSWTLIFAFFVLVFNFVLLETLATSLTMDQFAWSKMQSLYYMGILMSVGAVVACLSFVVIGPLCKVFEERKLLLWGGFLLTGLGSAFCIPWGPNPPKLSIPHNYNMSLLPPHLLNSELMQHMAIVYSPHLMENPNNTITEDGTAVMQNNTLQLSDALNVTTLLFTNNINLEDELGCPITQEWCLYTPAMNMVQFLIAYTFVSIGYPLGITLIQTIFSKILGPRPQGVWMGLLTGSGCLSRVMGPVFVGYVYARMGPVWTFSITTSLMVVSMVWIQFVNKRLRPPDTFKKMLGDTEMQELNGLTEKSKEGQPCLSNS